MKKALFLILCAVLLAACDSSVKQPEVLTYASNTHDYQRIVQVTDVEHTDTVAYAIAKEIWDEFDDYAKKKGRWTE